MVTIHSPGARERASSAMRSWMSRIVCTGPSAGKIDLRPSRSMWAWPSKRPGITALPLRSMMRVAGAVTDAIASRGPTLAMRSPAIASEVGDGEAAIDGDDLPVGENEIG